MFIILLFMVVGFFVGLAYVIRQRKMSFGKLLAGTLLGLMSVGILKILKSNYKHRKRFYL